MIVKTYNNGWGDHYPVSVLQKQIVDQYLAKLMIDQSRTVIINSTWYTTDFHQQVLAELQTQTFDCIVLIAMLDPAIPCRSWFEQFGCPVIELGYYPGTDFVDFWALVFDKYFDPVPVDQLLNPNLIDTAYICLNRKPHWHRRQLYNQLSHVNVLDQGFVTLGGDPPTRTLEHNPIVANLTPNSGPEQYGIVNDIVSLGNLDIWCRSFFNLVTETVWDINHNYFVSEKIYKPIQGCRPFLIYDVDSGSRWLTDRGFETYVADFKDITDLDLANGHNHAEFVRILCAQERTYWQHKFLALKDKILYNKNQFSVYVAQQKNNIKQGITCQI